jgi:hypothetical protein
MTANAVRLQLPALASNLCSVLRTHALLQQMESWSLITILQTLVKRGAQVIAHALCRFRDRSSCRAASPVPAHPRHDRRSATTKADIMLPAQSGRA